MQLDTNKASNVDDNQENLNNTGNAPKTMGASIISIAIYFIQINAILAPLKKNDPTAGATQFQS